jgi:hypothetical protein
MGSEIPASQCTFRLYCPMSIYNTIDLENIYGCLIDLLNFLIRNNSSRPLRKLRGLREDDEALNWSNIF